MRRIGCPERLEDLDPDAKYNIGKLSNFILPRGRRLDEALRNDPAAPEAQVLRTDKAVRARVYTGAQLLEYVKSALSPAELDAVSAAHQLIESLKIDLRVAQDAARREQRRAATEKVELKRRQTRAETRFEYLVHRRVENVLGAALEKAKVQAFDSLEMATCGVYFLYQKDRLRYVGQSVNIPARIAQHRKLRDFDVVRIFPCQANELNDWEGLFIRVLRPSENGRHWGGNVQAPVSELAKRLFTLSEDFWAAE